MSAKSSTEIPLGPKFLAAAEQAEAYLATRTAKCDASAPRRNLNPMSGQPPPPAPPSRLGTSPGQGVTAMGAPGPTIGAEEVEKVATYPDLVTRRFFGHSSATRRDTEAVFVEALRYQYPELHVALANTYTTNLLGFAAAGHASFTVIEEDLPNKYPETLMSTYYVPPPRHSLDSDNDSDDDDDEGKKRKEKSKGSVGYELLMAKLAYTWGEDRFLVYVVEGSKDEYGSKAYYILNESRERTEALLVAVGHWSQELHDEIWVFDGGWWDKSAELYQSVQHASWDDVILDEDMKKSIINDHLTFFRSRDAYKRLRVPWKRGIIYYGPPGNGKTISIKAMMNTLMKQKKSIPSLYVRSLASFAGPQAAIASIFSKARSVAPCYLIFEDIDTIVTANVRSYFLNEVDGLKGNDGIFMIGSTNHLDRLDPGISERPSRFDRKYLFPEPSYDERVAYCHYWQKKLADTKEIEFPDKLCGAIAGITDGFSFAYIQEAFVASLLAIARKPDDDDGGKKGGKGKVGLMKNVEDDWVSVLSADDDDDDLDKLVLWVEMKKQVAILREGMGKESEASSTA